MLNFVEEITSLMNKTDIDLRRFCFEKAVEILSWYNYTSRKKLNPMRLSEYIYLYLTKGEINDYSSVINCGQSNRNMEFK